MECTRLRLVHPFFLHVIHTEELMATPRTSDDITSHEENTLHLDADLNVDDLDWDADPALILERREQEFGINCFDQPIN